MKRIEPTSSGFRSVRKTSGAWAWEVYQGTRSPAMDKITEKAEKAFREITIHVARQGELLFAMADGEL